MWVPLLLKLGLDLARAEVLEISSPFVSGHLESTVKIKQHFGPVSLLLERGNAEACVGRYGVLELESAANSKDFDFTFSEAKIGIRTFISIRRG